MNDIRKHINLIESIQTTITENNSKYEDIVLDWFKRVVEDSEMNIDDIIYAGWMDDVWYDWIKDGKIPEDVAKNLKAYGSQKWEQLFSKKFGVASEDLAKGVSDEIFGKLSDDDKKIITALAKEFITSPEGLASDFENGELVYYINSPKSIVLYHYDNTNYPAVFVKPKDSGMTMENFVRWLDNHNARKVKRPSKRKTAAPYYD